jgi:hypothetical protein
VAPEADQRTPGRLAAEGRLDGFAPRRLVHNGADSTLLSRSDLPIVLV